MDVLERLVAEDDNSVEAWYLGGWCLHLLAEKSQSEGQNSMEMITDSPESDKIRMSKSSRYWLQNSLKLYGQQAYEDERLKEHAEELMNDLNKALGPSVEGEQDVEEEYEGWSDDDGAEKEDHAMEGT